MNLYPIKLLPFVSETIWGGKKLIEEAFGNEIEPGLQTIQLFIPRSKT